MKSIKDVQGFENENYKTLPREIKEDLIKQRSTISGIGRLSIVKISVLPTLIYRFKVNSIKTSADFLEKFTSWFKNLYGKSKRSIIVSLKGK